MICSVNLYLVHSILFETGGNKIILVIKELSLSKRRTNITKTMG